MIGGLPGAGATMRTVVNINAGGKTRLSAIIHSLVLLVILVAAASLASKIPLSVLGGILISVGVSIIDYKGLKHILNVPKTESVIMITVLFLTVFVNLLQAVAVGMVLAAFFLCTRWETWLNKKL
ncbi:MAG: SulP family sulfate permease [Francisellaceae bacterium]|jgi:SulP family sulfate permease